MKKNICKGLVAIFTAMALVGMTALAQAATLWPASTTPAVVDPGPDSAVELGVKFRSDVSGFITGIRFYKASANTGTHVGNLWSSSGTRLATATFSSETASGWQQVNFATPVAISANTVYVASYHASVGHYSVNLNYFTGQGMDSPPLHALASGISGVNGVYAYGASSSFPTLGWNNTNYWVDVVFTASPPPPVTLTSIAVTPASPTISAGASQQFTATGTYSNGGTQNLSSQVSWASSAPGVASITSSGLATGLSTGSSTISATLSGVVGSTNLTVQVLPLTITTTSLPNGTLNVPYAASLAASGGVAPRAWSLSAGALPAGLTLNPGTGVISGLPTASGTFSVTVRVVDSGIPQQTATKALSLTVSAQASLTIWPASTVPAVVDSGPDSAVELGVKFRSDVGGFITGVRFYKASANTGTHIGSLWSSSGTRLATATFSSETASGWQQVNFATPVAISANTVYVASYHASVGRYSVNVNYFTGQGMDSPPLHALASGVSGVNGVYAYGASSSFPALGWNNTNYWVDVVFTATPPPPVTLTSIAVTPAGPTISVGASQQFTATGTYSNGGTQNLSSQVSWASSAPGVASITSAGLATGLSAGSSTVSAALSGVVGSTSLTVQVLPLTITTASLPGGILNLPYSTTLASSGGTAPTTWSISAGALPAGLTLNAGTGEITGVPTVSGTFSLTVRVVDSGIPQQATTRALSIAIESGGPILILSSTTNPYSKYYTEILRTEGFNAFVETNISMVTSALLAQYDVVILGELSLSTSQVTLLSNWVNAGGNLIAMRPDKKLAGLLGLTDQASSLSNAYLRVNTSGGPGFGIVSQTIQFHGAADLYSPNGATTVATLYSTATAATTNPAVTLKSVGTNGGLAAAFVYDLARSVVYTRQGNPAWAEQDRDGLAPIRSNDLFYGAASIDPQPDWIDFSKVAIPQADEQQRLLANLIIQMNFNKKPLPRFWYLPRNLAAAVVMTGDDHGNNGTEGRFNTYTALSQPGCSVDNWECIRGTSYIYPHTPLSEPQALLFNDAGFEVALHVDTNCEDYTPTTLQQFYSSQLATWKAKYFSLPSPVTHRAHCIVWSDYVTQPLVELAHGIRLDTTYYYYPSSWVADRPGFFTGSGMPMRFADAAGNLIDVYQAATQLTDESSQTYPATIDVLLDRALGPEGYYGVFTVNAHTDLPVSTESAAVVNSAKSRGIPVISARQLLAWLDARNASRFGSISWNGSVLGFAITTSQNANGLVALVPVPVGQTVDRLERNGSVIPFSLATIKGGQYARFSAIGGDYEVQYIADTTPPVVSAVSPAAGVSGVSTGVKIAATFSEPMDSSTVNNSTFELRDPTNTLVPTTVFFNAATQTATLQPTAPLLNSATYTTILAGGGAGVKDVAGNSLTSNFSWSFTTSAVSAGPYSIWNNSKIPSVVDVGPDSAVELGVKFRADTNGQITGIRFYKASTNVGTHVANLWSNSGALLATATFTTETATGWQQVNFSTPVAVTANTVYVASYHTSTGHYSLDLNYFTGKGEDNSPLHALAEGVSGSNGVYAYGSSSRFPNQGWNSSNYWVDVVFQP